MKYFSNYGKLKNEYKIIFNRFLILKERKNNILANFPNHKVITNVKKTDKN